MKETVRTLFFSKMKVIVGVQSLSAAGAILDRSMYAWQTAKLTVVKLRQAQLPELQSH
jgi:hypothetical protein